jgi:RNA-directed DNA polymerase
LNGKLGISPKSVKRAKEKIRQITRRNRGVSLAKVIAELNSFLIGWLNYYRYAACRFELQRLDEWIRRKLRCYRLKQRKRGKSVADFLRRLGLPAYQAARIGSSEKGWWRLSNSPPVKKGLSNDWFSQQGLVSLVPRYDALRHLRNRRIHPSTYGGVGGRGREAPPTRFQAVAQAIFLKDAKQ